VHQGRLLLIHLGSACRRFSLHWYCFRCKGRLHHQAGRFEQLHFFLFPNQLFFFFSPFFFFAFLIRHAEAVAAPSFSALFIASVPTAPNLRTQIFRLSSPPFATLDFRKQPVTHLECPPLSRSDWPWVVERRAATRTSVTDAPSSVSSGRPCDLDPLRLSNVVEVPRCLPEAATPFFPSIRRRDD